MYGREELLNELTERKVYQEEYLSTNPNDRIARNHLESVERYLSKLNNHEEEPEQKFLVFQNDDNRRMGDDWSEVSKTPIFRCCRPCAETLQFWLRDKMRDLKSVYYSIGEDKGQKLNEKIVVYPARTMREAYDSDEMRINSEWLEGGDW